MGSLKQEPFVYGSLGGDDVSLVPAAATPPASSDSVNTDIRRDYELAERIGTKAGWDAFVTNYPTGFYSELAKAQRDKLIAEQARVAATERAKAAADEKSRLAAEGARASVQAKAAAQAQAAEDARIAAEKNKAAEQAKVAAAERAKTAALTKTAGDKAADDANVAADKKTPDDKPAGQVANLSSTDQPAGADVRSGSPAVVDIPRMLQSELRRVGCNTGSIDGKWNAAAQKSLELFNKNAGTKLDVKVASLDALDVVKSKPARICPLVCDHGYRADGEGCTRVTCRAGFEVGDDNTCERIEPRRRPVQRAPRPAGRPQRTASERAAAARPSGQIICLPSGCRPVRNGCRLEIQGYSGGNQHSGQAEVCN
jgi:hypothetical protein